LNNPFRWNRSDLVFRVTLGFAAALGLFLRLFLIFDQVLLDDEWHALYYVVGKSPGFLLTHFAIPGATCIPLNLYTWLLGATVGYSEILLRLPSLICGLACVIVFPLLVRKFIGARASIIFSFLLACSPLLIFYSRNCRPYSAVALFGLLTIIAAVHWLETRRSAWGILYAASAILAIYFHLFSIVTIAAASLIGFVVHIRARLPGNLKGEPFGPPLRYWVAAHLLIAVISVALVLPALIHSAQTTLFKDVALKGIFDLKAMLEVPVLISGTGQIVLASLFWTLVCFGAVVQCRCRPWFGAMLLVLVPLHALALWISRPDCAHSAIVLTRYCLPLVPVSLLLAACGIQQLLESLRAATNLRPASQGITAAATVAALAAAGPLPQCYVSPNAFTNHSAYQNRYSTLDWRHSYDGFPSTTIIRADEVSSVYKRLAGHRRSRPIVEYPMMLGDYYNPFYYYQHFHHRPVIVGYATHSTNALALAPGYVFGNTYVDEAMTVIAREQTVNFHGMLHMDDLAGMRARGVEMIVIHKIFEAQLCMVAPPPPELERIRIACRQLLGPPEFEDEHVEAFRLGPPASEAHSGAMTVR